LVFVTDIDAIGLETAQGLLLSEAFYWDLNDETRAFSKRFMQRVGRVPSAAQAGVYSSVMHYLKAVKAGNSDDAAVVNATMRKMPVDRFGREARILANGRVVYDLGVYRVKTPSESKFPWDYYERIATVPASEAFRSLEASGCGAEQDEAKTR
jgi:branched-chain amino acid transport system substrate-binding protein